MTWFLYALLSIIFFTILNILQRVVAVDSKNPRATAIVFNGTASLIALMLYILLGSYRSFMWPTTAVPWMLLLLAAFCYGMYERGRFRAAKMLESSIFITIINVSVLVAFVGSLIIYKEAVTATKLVGAVAIIVALFLASYKKATRPVSQKGILLTIGLSTILGIGWLLDKQGVQNFGSETYSLLIWVVPLLVIFFPSIPVAAVRAQIKKGFWKIGIIACANVFGYLSMLKALSLTEATRVIPIIQTSLLFTVILGIVLLNEKEDVVKKLFAGVLALLGIYFLA